MLILDGTDTGSSANVGGFIIGELNGDTIVLEDEDESFTTGLDPFRSTFDAYSGQNFANNFRW